MLGLICLWDIMKFWKMFMFEIEKSLYWLMKHNFLCHLEGFIHLFFLIFKSPNDCNTSFNISMKLIYSIFVNKIQDVYLHRYKIKT